MGGQYQKNFAQIRQLIEIYGKLCIIHFGCRCIKERFLCEWWSGGQIAIANETDSKFFRHQYFIGSKRFLNILGASYAHAPFWAQFGLQLGQKDGLCCWWLQQGERLLEGD
jgi:hypothetical protein